MASGTQLVLALILGLALLIFFILKTKIQTFPALIISAVLVGIIGGLPIQDIMKTISEGFGKTLGSIGIVIGLGVMMGKILEESGAAKKMALSILKLIGIEKVDVALGLAGLLVSIPVFCDSGFVILSELAKEFSRITKKSMVRLGAALGLGLYLTHHLVPPTPGPLAVAGLFGVDIGKMILVGVLITIPLFTIGMIYVRRMSDKMPEIIPPSTTEANNFKEEDLPGKFVSFAPIVVPIILILINTVTKASGKTNSFISLVGNPITAVTLGLLIAIYGLTKNKNRQDTVKALEKSLSDAGLIIFITGAGGALGTILRVSGIGDFVAKSIAASSFPALLVPLLMGALLKLAQGSGTVAMITTASIVAPMVGALGLNPLVAALAVCIGPMCASYFNDSYFWVVTKFSGMDVKTGLRAWTTTTIVPFIAGSIVLFILNAFM